MSRAFRIRILLPISCVCFAVTVLAGCGGSNGSSETVAQVGGYAVTKAMLNQWMTEKVGNDFYEVATHEAPPRLVSEPANYPACIASLKAITPIPGKGRPQPQPTVAQLTQKCEELYRGIKEQALTFLVSSLWTTNFDAAHGMNVSEAEVRHRLKRRTVEQYPKQGEFQQLLKSRRRTLSEELFILKMDMLQEKLEKRYLDHGKQSTATLIREAESPAYAASCDAGYIVEHCKGYKPPKERFASHVSLPSVLLEEVARWRPETSHGFTGVPVT